MAHQVGRSGVGAAAALGLAVAMAAAASCSRGPEIRVYRADKEKRLDAGRAAEQAAAEAPAAGDLLTYAVPEGWRELPAEGMRKAAFQAGDAEVTVIDLAAQAGEVLPNVNRWRGQVGLGPLAPGELDDAVRPLEIGGETGAYVELIGPPEAAPRRAILGAIVRHGGRAWFFKLMGPAEAAEREKGRFLDLLDSVRFAAAAQQR